MLSQKVSHKNPPALRSSPEQQISQKTATNSYNITNKIFMEIPPTFQSSDLYNISVIINVTQINTASTSVCITPDDLIPQSV
jgi:hypothetical protein